MRWSRSEALALAAERFDPSICDPVPRKPFAEDGEIPRTQNHTALPIRQETGKLISQPSDVILGDENNACFRQRRSRFAPFISHNWKSASNAGDTAAAPAGKSPTDEE
jgi:hypothetical protein